MRLIGVLILTVLASGCGPTERQQHYAHVKASDKYVVVPVTSFRVEDGAGDSPALYHSFRHPEDPDLICTYAREFRAHISCAK